MEKKPKVLEPKPRGNSPTMNQNLKSITENLCQIYGKLGSIEQYSQRTQARLNSLETSVQHLTIEEALTSTMSPPVQIEDTVRDIEERLNDIPSRQDILELTEKMENVSAQQYILHGKLDRIEKSLKSRDRETIQKFERTLTEIMNSSTIAISQQLVSFGDVLDETFEKLCKYIEEAYQISEEDRDQLVSVLRQELEGCRYGLIDAIRDAAKKEDKV